MVKLNSNNPSISEFTRYAALGAASFVINLGLAATFHEILALAEWLAVALSLSIVFVINFVAAKFVVFKSQGNWKRELPNFLVSSLLSRVFEYVIFLILFGVFSINYLFAIMISQILSFVLKYFVYKRYVFSSL
jgi:putative flippase GtrA